MATYTLCPLPRLGITPSPGMLIYTVSAGGAYPGNAVNTYSTDSGVVNANPITANGAGLLPAIYLQPGQNYKFIVTDMNGVTIFTQDGVQAVPGSASAVDVVVTAGENIAAEASVYISDGSAGKNAGQAYNASATNMYSSTTAGIVGMALAAITSGSQGSVRIAGQFTLAQTLTPGSLYYIGTTAGSITSTAPSNARYLGEADGVNSITLAANPAGAPGLDLLQIEALLG